MSTTVNPDTLSAPASSIPRPPAVALVTGASSGIGQAAADELLLRGVTVYAAARRVDRMAGLKDLGARVLELDVTDDASLIAAVDTIIEQTGRVDILVNNAGYGSYGTVEDVPLAEARRQMEVNLFGLARLTQLVLPQMRAQGSGRIVNVSSAGGRFAMTPGGWYHATKYALEALSDALRQEVRQFGIEVVVVEPGMIRTEWPGIAARHLRATSGAGPYAELADRFASGLELVAAHERLGSDPVVVGRAIARAATMPRPRSRYAVGLGAKPGLYLLKLLPAQAMDGVTRLALRLPRRPQDG